MTIGYDPDFAKGFAPLATLMAQSPKPEPGDVKGFAEVIKQFHAALGAQIPDHPTVSHKMYYCTSKDGHQVPIYHFFRNDCMAKPAEKTSAVIYYYGGGYIGGSVEAFRKQIAARVASTGVPFFAVNYRLAPEHQHPKPLEDGYAGLMWLYEHAHEFNADTSRIGVYGESAGGGIAAGVALLARENAVHPPLAKQILIYPMLDDRNVIPNPHIEPFLVWSYDNNATAWKALLGSQSTTSNDAGYYAAPARATSLNDLPSAYIEVGSLDIFMVEDIEYARRLHEGGIEVQLYVWPGVPHSFETLAPDSKCSRKAADSRDEALKSF